MISQADIIRALVNKNCTDESIMSLALSPDCTPTKLLEKFNEAERFDLALDVSMKLGLDVSPIWKTWAMRCLKNRNFKDAREKFRHCFLRLRSAAGRGSPAYSNLLSDILNELIPMEDAKLPLSEEIDLIKNRRKFHPNRGDKNAIASREPSSIRFKPVIQSECLHYLKEYGTIEDQIKFSVRTSMWNEAIKLLLDNRAKINADRFFIPEVILKTSTAGRLDDLLATFLERDPDIRRAFKYYKALYNHYKANRRFNSLYYLQNKIGDFVAAAENQITNFFLKRPAISYKDLNSRLPRLVDAKTNYMSYLKHLEELDSGNDNDTVPESCSLLFSSATLEEAKYRLKTIDTQIEITRNFSINEVQGSINSIEVVCDNLTVSETSGSGFKDDNIPVTLFDTCKRRRTFLTALVLIYFDLECKAYFATSGLSLANRLIKDYKLDKINVFKTAMRIIFEDESCDIINGANLLLQRLTEDHLATHRKSKLISPSKSKKKSSKHVVIREVAHITENDPSTSKKNDTQLLSSSQTVNKGFTNSRPESYQVQSTNSLIKPGTSESARMLCDEVIRDSIRSCNEQDYKMKLANLLSPEAKIELYIELGKLSNAQRLAFDMNRRDYVAIVLREAERLNQDHIKDVCQHWLAKH